MNEKTAGGEKTAKPSKSETKSTTPASDRAAPAADNAAPAADSAAPAADSAAVSGGKSTKAQAASDHSPSYFSSVSSPQYRARWDSIFSPGGKPATRKPRAKRNNGLPVTIALEPADLDDAVRAGIEAAFRRKAKARRITFDRFMKQAQMTWRLECEFTD